MTSYREYLARRGLQPLVIPRTEKKPGDLVLVHACRPVEVVK